MHNLGWNPGNFVIYFARTGPCPMMCLCARSWLVVLNRFRVCWSNAMVGGHCQQLRKASHTKWNYWEAILNYASYVYLDFPISRLFSCIVRRLHVWIAVHLLVHWNFPLTTLKIVLTSVLMLAFWLQTQKGQTHTLNHVHLKWEDLVLPDAVELTLVLLQSMMSQTRRSPRHFVLSSYPDGDPEDEMYGNLLAAPDTAEQMEFNIRYHAARMLLLSSAPGYNPPRPQPSQRLLAKLWNQWMLLKV